MSATQRGRGFDAEPAAVYRGQPVRTPAEMAAHDAEPEERGRERRLRSVDVVAIDPGSERSAWVALRGDGSVAGHGLEQNTVVLGQLRAAFLQVPPGRGGERVIDVAAPGRVVVIEWMAPRGMPTSAQELETCWWAGRFAEAVDAAGGEAERLTRHRVKVHLVGARQERGGPSADSRIRAALIDRYGGTGGKAAAVGLKASPGPLYGMAADVWAALAVACAWRDGAR